MSLRLIRQSLNNEDVYPSMLDLDFGRIKAKNFSKFNALRNTERCLPS